jgi:hypothetical protein
MDVAGLRTFALGLPGTAERPHFEMTSFRVGDRIFVTVPPDGEHAHVFVDEEQVQAAVQDLPHACAQLWWGKRLTGVRIRLAQAPRERVEELVEEAWRRRAPRRLVAGHDAAKNQPPDGGT